MGTSVPIGHVRLDSPRSPHTVVLDWPTRAEPVVVFDTEAGAYQAVEHLIQHLRADRQERMGPCHGYTAVGIAGLEPEMACQDHPTSDRSTAQISQRLERYQAPTTARDPAIGAS
jgi:DNA-binding LacI/PurR family transcriptional regulator